MRRSKGDEAGGCSLRGDWCFGDRCVEQSGAVASQVLSDFARAENLHAVRVKQTAVIRKVAIDQMQTPPSSSSFLYYARIRPTDPQFPRRPSRAGSEALFRPVLCAQRVLVRHPRNRRVRGLAPDESDSRPSAAHRAAAGLVSGQLGVLGSLVHMRIKVCVPRLGQERFRARANKHPGSARWDAIVRRLQNDGDRWMIDTLGLGFYSLRLW